MVNKPLARARLITQGVVVPLESKAPAGTPEHAQEIAYYFTATQGQDFPGAISSLAYRMGTVGAVDAVREAFNQGFIVRDRKSTRLNSSHVAISYDVFCLKKKK